MSNELYHYGIKGQRWGIRRYQNEDGTYTSEGAARRRIGDRYHKDNSATENKDLGKGVGRYSSDAPLDICKKAERVNGGKTGYTNGYNRHRNCCFCAVAYEQISRGKNVRAKASELGGYGDSIARNLFSNYNKERDYKYYAVDVKSMMRGTTKEEYSNLCSDILKDGKNTRGTIQVRWKGTNGGHIFNYETRDGKIFFVDGQVSKVMNEKDAYTTYFKNACKVRKFRTDNKKMNKKADLFVEPDKTELNLSNKKLRSGPLSNAQRTTIKTSREILKAFFPLSSYIVSTTVRKINDNKLKAEREDVKKLIEDQKKLKINDILGENRKVEIYKEELLDIDRIRKEQNEQKELEKKNKGS